MFSWRDLKRMDIAAIIRKAREGLKISQTELARRLGVTKTTVSKWEKGESAPNRNRARAVARVLGIEESAILEHARVGFTLLDQEASGRMIPYMTMGDFYKLNLSMEPALLTGFPRVMADIEDDDEAVALVVETNDMAGEVNAGDVVIVSKKLTPRMNDLVVAIAGDDIVLRRFQPRGCDSSGAPVFDLLSTNPDVATRTVNTAFPGRILAVVVEHRRKRAP